MRIALLLIVAFGATFATTTGHSQGTDNGPVWRFARGDGQRLFTGAYGSPNRLKNATDPATATLIVDAPFSEVQAFRVGGSVTVIVLKNSTDFAVVGDYRVRGEDDGQGVYRIVFSDGVKSFAKGPDTGLIFLAEMPGLKSLNLSGLPIVNSNLSSNSWQALEQLRNLESINLSGIQEPGRYLQSLRHCTELSTINLSNTKLSDAEIGSLSVFKKLKRLELQATYVSDQGLERLGAFSDLDHLNISGTFVTKPAADAFQRQHPQLTLRWSEGTSPILRAAIDTIRASGGNIHKLFPAKDVDYYEISFNGSTPPKYTDEVLEAISTIPKLKRLLLSGTGLRDDNLRKVTNLHLVESLALQYVGEGITDATLAYLREMPNLRELRIEMRSGIVTDNGMSHLAGMSSLERLTIQSMGISDAGLVHLRNLTSLKSLLLGNTFCTPAGVTELKQALPKTQVHVDCYYCNLETIGFGNESCNGQLQHLDKMPKLRHVTIQGSQQGGVTNEGLAYLARLPNLRSLFIETENITDVGMPQVASLRQLEVLIIRSKNVSDLGIRHLQSLTALRTLNLDTACTRQGIDALRKSLPKAGINPGR